MHRWLGVLFVVLGMISQTALAEDKTFSVQSLTVSSGENAVSGGLTGTLQLSNKRNDLLEVTVQQEIAWLLAGRKLKIGKSTDLVIAGSLGHHQGSVWVGPFVSVARPLGKYVGVGGFYWPGWYPTREPSSRRNDNKPNPERLFLGHLASATVTIGPVGLTYSWQDYLNEPPQRAPRCQLHPGGPQRPERSRKCHLEQQCQELDVVPGHHVESPTRVISFRAFFHRKALFICARIISMSMRTIEQVGDLNGKRVLMRVDFDDVPEGFRIKRQQPMIQYLRDQGAQVTLIAHGKHLGSFGLKNLRDDPGEEANDPVFAQQLAAGHDLFVNNAFAVCHRAHASVVGVAKLLPSYAGDVVVEEAKRLSEVLDAPAQGKVVVIGGAKTSTKIPVINALLSKSSEVLVGGVVANELIDTKAINDPRLLVPTDFVFDGEFRRDIGPLTATNYANTIARSKLVIWNGPMGMFEDDRFLDGTKIVAASVASAATSVVGGGDSIAALAKLGIPLEKFSFVSTGGGAMLAFLAGDRLPGLEVLGYYQ